MSRLQAWTLESRARYALVWGALNAAAVSSVVVILAVFTERSAGYALTAFAIALVANVSFRAFVGYPRAKRELTPPG